MHQSNLKKKGNIFSFVTSPPPLGKKYYLLTGVTFPKEKSKLYNFSCIYLKKSWKHSKHYWNTFQVVKLDFYFLKKIWNFLLFLQILKTFFSRNYLLIFVFLWLEKHEKVSNFFQNVETYFFHTPKSYRNPLDITKIHWWHYAS